MHKVFGEKKEVEYHDRRGAYIIPRDGDKVAVVKTAKGYFLLGGGIENDETDEECIVRECLEEIGYEVSIEKYLCSAESYCEHPVIGYFHPSATYYVGKLLEQKQAPIEQEHCLVWVKYDELQDKLFVEMQNWALKELEEK